VAGARLWNSLPHDIVASDTLSQFHYGLKTFLFRQSYPSVLYKSLVRPHLEYCTVAWSPHYVNNKELLERVQRRFTRMIPELKALSYPDRMNTR